MVSERGKCLVRTDRVRPGADASTSETISRKSIREMNIENEANYINDGKSGYFSIVYNFVQITQQ